MWNNTIFLNQVSVDGTGGMFSNGECKDVICPCVWTMTVFFRRHVKNVVLIPNTVGDEAF